MGDFRECLEGSVCCLVRVPALIIWSAQGKWRENVSAECVTRRQRISSVCSNCTCNGLDGPGIECLGGGGEIFRPSPDRPWDPPSLLYNGYLVFPGGKERPGRDAYPSPPSGAIGYKRVELYLHSPYGSYGLYRASVLVQGWPSTLHFTQALNVTCFRSKQMFSFRSL
jgi:hypothetical protein